MFEILHIRVDEGLEVRDVFGGRKLWITERSATRGVQLGDHLAGWVMVYDDGNRLEGALCHVPARFADAFVSSLRKHRNALSRKHPKLSRKQLNGLLPPRVAPLLEEVFAQAPLPELSTFMPTSVTVGSSASRADRFTTALPLVAESAW